MVMKFKVIGIARDVNKMAGSDSDEMAPENSLFSMYNDLYVVLVFTIEPL